MSEKELHAECATWLASEPNYLETDECGFILTFQKFDNSLGWKKVDKIFPISSPLLGPQTQQVIRQGSVVTKCYFQHIAKNE